MSQTTATPILVPAPRGPEPYTQTFYVLHSPYPAHRAGPSGQPLGELSFRGLEKCCGQYMDPDKKLGAGTLFFALESDAEAARLAHPDPELWVVWPVEVVVPAIASVRWYIS